MWTIYIFPGSVHKVIRFVLVSAKFGTCTVESVNGTLVAAKMCTFTLKSTHFIFNKCPLYTQDSASAKISTNSHGTVYSDTFLQQNRLTDHGNIQYKSLEVTWMRKLGVRPHNYFSGNICFKFSLLCLCRVRCATLAGLGKKTWVNRTSCLGRGKKQGWKLSIRSSQEGYKRDE